MVVSALSNEPQTKKTHHWLANQQAGTLYISDWTITEFSSALSMKLRIGHIDTGQRAECLALFARLVEENLIVLEPQSRNFRTAATYIDQYQTGLRAGDALHLAICAQHGTRLVTYDKLLAKAALVLGIPTLDKSEIFGKN